MDTGKLILKLHPLERMVLARAGMGKKLPQIIAKSKLQEIEVMRALQWLENKGRWLSALKPRKLSL